MQVSQYIIEPAKDASLLTNYEARVSLNMANSTDENLDDLIDLLVKWASDEISVQCSRTFAKETLRETFREINDNSKRLYLSHYPPVEIISVTSGGLTLVEDNGFEVDYEGGKLTRLGAVWADPTVVTYTGGYDLPAEAPPALQQAAILMAREAYYASTRGDATIRMVSHKDSRVIYFDPNTALKAMGGGGSGGSPARRAIGDLLKCYMHFEV